MSNPSPEKQGRRCQAAVSELLNVINSFAANEDVFKKSVVRDILEPADLETIEINGRQWSRHQCLRCGMAILRLNDNDSHMIIDNRFGSCADGYGQLIIKNYPVWPREPLE